MKLKRWKGTEFDKKMKEAEDLIEPYVNMVFCFTAEADNSEELDEYVAEWAFGACMVKLLHPELAIFDLLPQNLEKTMDRLKLNEESMLHFMKQHPELESYI